MSEIFNHSEHMLCYKERSWKSLQCQK